MGLDDYIESAIRGVIKNPVLDIEPLGAGSGIASLETGLRLRYEFVRRFAPYLGFTYASTFGTTRHYDAVDDLRAVGGIRFWF